MGYLTPIDIKHLLAQGYHCFGRDFVCTLKHCKSSKVYSVYDKFFGDMHFVCSCCSLTEALSIVRYLRRRGHDVNYIQVQDCLYLPSPSFGQLSLDL